jgi:hypothetical protein
MPGTGCARRPVGSMRRGFVLVAAAAVAVAAASQLSAAELESLGPCRSDAHEGLTCGTGDGAARVIADTFSPSKRLALAWRSPSSPPTEEPDTDDLELLLIRLSDGAILSKSKGAYWNTGESHANREYEKAAWSPDSRLMVETYDTRFSTDGLTVTAIGPDDKASAPLDLLRVMEPAVRAQLRRAVKDEASYVLSLHRVVIDDRGMVHALVQMWVPKEGPFAAFDVTAAITRKGDGLVPRITSVRRSREKL